MRFFWDVIREQFPSVTLVTHSPSWWTRVVHKAFAIDLGTMAVVVGNTIRVPQEFLTLEFGESLRTEVLAHEYTHLWQRYWDDWRLVKRACPALVALGVAFVGIVLDTQWLTLFAMIPLLPVYNPAVAQDEFEAYCSSMLARVCMSNNSVALPPIADKLLAPSDAVLRGFVDNMFSSTYLMHWAPGWVREVYFRRFKRWRIECKTAYFLTRLAFDKNNGYLPTSFNIRKEVLVGTAHWRGCHLRILRYLVAAR